MKQRDDLLQLDRTHVVVRVRTLPEIGDLAMVMIRRYPAALLIGFALGALPWAIANAALLSWIPLQESNYGLLDEEAFGEMTRYCMWMMLLVILQTPIAGVFTTIYLGDAVFEQRPTWSSVFKEAKENLWRWFYVLGVLRLAAPTMAFLVLRIGSEFNAFADVIVPLCLIVGATLIRGGRPFMPEILLLEKCPLRETTPNAITAKRRSKSLHTPMASELSGRFVSVSFIFFWVFLSVLYTLVFVKGIATNDWTWGLFLLLVLFPAALWIVASLSILIRLLSYLDTRIRLEGWEVELSVRAEAIRQFGEEAAINPAARPDANPSVDPVVPELLPTENAGASR